MLFNEIYSSYYNAVAAIISKAVSGELRDKDIYDIVRDKAFSESIAAIPDALKKGRWPFLAEDNTSVFENKPERPLSTLEKRWLKAIMNDSRIKLFDLPMEGLNDVESLFSHDDFVYFDRYTDGDPYDDENYINNFRAVIGAIKEGRKLRIEYNTKQGERRTWVLVPDNLEYSSKDDKFRLIAWLENSRFAINMARIYKAEPLEKHSGIIQKEQNKKELELELTDSRNALERAMLHFSHFEKETRKLDDSRYSLKLRYMAEDESELVIRVLSFGPALKAVSPHDFVEKIKERLEKQRKLYSICHSERM